MKKQEKNHLIYLANIRKQKRNTETLQIKNVIRFNRQIQNFQQENERQQYKELTQDQLQFNLQSMNYNAIFDSIINGGRETIQVIEQNIASIVPIIFERLNNPKSALALDNICRQSPLFIGFLFQTSKILQLVHHLRKLPSGSKQQTIYLSCICPILQQKEFIQVDQFASLFDLIQQIFYSKQQDKQKRLIIRIITFMIDISNQKYHFNLEFLQYFLQCFWNTENAVNHINIYISAISIVNLGIYKKSVSLLMNIVRIIIRGRKMLPLKIQVEIPSKLYILVKIFQFYNDNVQYMQHFGVIYLQKLTIQASIHDFFLQYQTSIFKDYQRSEIFLQFLDEFCKNGPIEKIVDQWSDLGLLQQIISEMTTSINICYKSLTLCFTLLSRNQAISNTSVAHLMMNCNIKEAIEQVLQVYNESRVKNLSNAILSYLIID